MISGNTQTTTVWPDYVSPNTGKILNLAPDGKLRSDDGETFQIHKGIPYFVPNDEYVSNFGAQWNKFLRTQLDSYTGLPISRDRLRRCVGEEAWSKLSTSTVLEVGCGAGRFTEVLLSQGAHVMSVDLSSAVDANAKNCPIGETHRIAKADVMKLPFKPRQFDVVICLGVIQHTPNSEATIAKLYEHVKPGGWLIIDHYTHEKGRWSSIKPFFRAYMKKLPPDRTLPTVEKFVDMFLPWHRRFRNFYPAWFLLCRISPIVTFYRLIPELREPLQREWAALDTHDSLTDWFKHLRDLPQIEQCMKGLGVEQLWSNEGGNGIESRGRRPLK